MFLSKFPYINKDGSGVHNMSKFFSTLFFTLLCVHVLCKNRTIDSLSNSIKICTNPSQRITLLCELSEKYTEIGEFDRGGVLANEALVLATARKEEKGTALAYYTHSRLYQYLGDYSKALSYHFKALPLFEKLNAYENLGWTYLNMGIIYNAQHNYHKAIEYEKKSLIYFKKANSKKGEAYSYLNMSIACIPLRKLDTALMYMQISRKICLQINDLRGLGYVLNNIADIYKVQGLYDKALQCNLECIELRKAEDDKMDLAYCYANVGTLYVLKKDLYEAKKYLLLSEDYAKKLGARLVLRRTYLYLSKLDSLQGNYKGAYEYYKLYSHYQDLLSNEENGRKAIELQAMYEQEKKDKEIQVLKREQEKQNIIAEDSQQKLIIIILSVLAGLITVIAFSMSLYKRVGLLRRQKSIISKQKERSDEQHKRIKDSILYARRIQRALLTSEDYIKAHLNLEFFIYYQPKDIVSGDFYWATQHQGKFYLITADCTGHGVPGAFMSLLNISILNELIVEKNLSSPAQILNHQRKHIIKALNPSGTENSKDGMDCVLCKFDLDNTKLTFSAANNPLWLIRNNSLQEFKGDKMPVGKHLDAEKDFTEYSVDLENGDMIYTFTDGIVDQFGGDLEKKFKQRQLTDLLMEIHVLPVEQQKEKIEKAFNEWKGSKEQTDDVLIIGVKL